MHAVATVAVIRSCISSSLSLSYCRTSYIRIYVVCVAAAAAAAAAKKFATVDNDCGSADFVNGTSDFGLLHYSDLSKVLACCSSVEGRGKI